MGTMASIAATKDAVDGSIANSILANDFPAPTHSSNESVIAAIGYSRWAEASARPR